MRVFWLLMFGVYLFSQDMVEVYRLYGIEETKNRLEKFLSSKDYWLEKIGDKDIKLGYFEGDKYILFCNKHNKKLDVYKTEDNRLKSLNTYDVLTGLAGEKYKEGDLRTPIGVYRLNSIKTNIDEFYGPFAFVTSYPNFYDRVNSKDGHGIWIHGKPLVSKRDSNNTKGCIALDNDKLAELKDKIDYKKTYLLIAQQHPFFATKEDIASILAFIYQWREAWRELDFKRYISFYANNFKKGDGKDLEAFKDYKRKIFANKRGQKIEIFFKDINIVPYQNMKGKKLYRVDMFEEYLSDSYKFKGKKELIVDIDKNNSVKIVVEK